MVKGLWMQIKAVWALTVLLMHLSYRFEISHIKRRQLTHPYLIPVFGVLRQPCPISPQQKTGDLLMRRSNRWSLSWEHQFNWESGSILCWRRAKSQPLFPHWDPRTSASGQNGTFLHGKIWPAQEKSPKGEETLQETVQLVHCLGRPTSTELPVPLLHREGRQGQLPSKETLQTKDTNLQEETIQKECIQNSSTKTCH